MNALLERWKFALSGDDQNAVARQLRYLSVHLATFQCINEARRHTPKTRRGAPQANGFMHSLVDDGFAILALTAMRRQADSEAMTGDRGVFSLKAVLSDIRANRDILTRGSLLEFDGLPYEYEAQKASAWQDLAAAAAAGDQLPRYGRIEPWLWSELRHAQIDELCKVDASARSPHDIIDDSILSGAILKLEVQCQPAINYVNKFIAHASSVESRGILQSPAQSGITLQYLLDTHRLLCQLAAFAEMFLFRVAASYLPTPQFDHLEYLDKPLLRKRDVPVLDNVWSEFSDRCAQYSNTDATEHIAELRAFHAQHAQRQIDRSTIDIRESDLVEFFGVAPQRVDAEAGEPSAAPTFVKRVHELELRFSLSPGARDVHLTLHELDREDPVLTYVLLELESASIERQVGQTAQLHASSRLGQRLVILVEPVIIIRIE